ncbi:MAG: hypothetical protein L7F78_01650 [Syntrophales bacterium LBB04]|nr:hypothetical protein [Syntrophales bacterium LBB04]
MEKAKLRQRIMLGLVSLAVLYGLYDLTSSKMKRAAPDLKVKSAELQTFIQQTAESLARDKPSAFDKYVVSRAEGKWVRSPFSGQPGPSGTEKSKGAALFVFTGYVEIGSRKVVIINNAEYSVGDPLDKEGYFVKMISPSSVLIENITDKTQFQVPIKE